MHPEEAITDEDASFLDVMFATIAGISIFLISKTYFNPTWAVMLSTCVFFSSMISLIFGRMIYFLFPVTDS
jgi:hypothetical protein